MKKIGLQRVGDIGSANEMQKIVTAMGNTAYGGTGLDTSSSTGIAVVNGGTWSVPSNAMITPEGGYAIKLINRTGHASVKGEIVKASTSTAGEAIIAATSDDMPIGCVYNAGVAEGSAIWVVVAGIAEVLYDASGATLGYFVCVSSATAGRADGTNATPPTTLHWREIGHAIASASANSLGKIVMHFN